MLTAAVPASAGFLDFLFGGPQGFPQQRAPEPQQPYDPYQANPAPQAPVAPRESRYSGFCVRSCDGRYFQVQSRGGVSPAQLCQAFCPAANTKVFYGGSIEGSVSSTGERYTESENAFLFRKTIKKDCTCNGRTPAGLAPVDLSLDTTLRAGDVVATSNGLVAFTGIHVGNNMAAEFIPVSEFPGLTPDVRARLGEMKVSPTTPDTSEDVATVIRPPAAPAPAPAPPPKASNTPATAPANTPARGSRAQM